MNVDPKARSEAGYHQFTNESGESYGSFYVTFLYAEEIRAACAGAADCYPEAPESEGWYWQAGFPGCIPDGEPVGPYATSLEAREAAAAD